MRRWRLAIGLLPILLLAAGTCGAQEVDPVIIADSAYPDAPAFTIAPRAGRLAYDPCDKCHRLMAMYPELAEEYDSHPVEFDHGRDVMGCATCHDATKPEYLLTLLGEKLNLARTPQLCGSCHAEPYRDWHFGAHGKRLDNWRGERVIHACSHCHDPHVPAISPRRPSPPPGLRAGLDQPTGHPREVARWWEDQAPAATTEVPNDGN